MKSNKTLAEMAEANTKEYQEALSIAKTELKKRIKNQFSELNSQSEFPEKPIISHKKQSYKKSFFSLIIFITAFYFIFDWDLSYILIISGVLLIHELGHLLAMKAYKYKDLNIFFIPLFGAITSGTKKDISQKQKVLISLAGPLPGIIIGSFIYANGYALGNDLYIQIGYIFIFLNLFNLLPVMPLDGGRILKDLFFYKKEKISIIFLWVSIVCLIIISLKIEAFLLLLIPVFLYSQISIQNEHIKIRQLLINKGFDINKDFEKLSNEEYWLIRDELAINMKIISRIVSPKRYVEVSNEEAVVNTLIQILQKPLQKKMSIRSKICFTFLWISAFLIPFLIFMGYYIIGLINI